MKKILILIIVSLFAAGCLAGEGESLGDTKEKEYRPTWAVDDQGKQKYMDFTIPLTGISDPGMMFTHFSQRNLVIFYFSPMCSHCAATYPEIEAIVNKYATQGLSAIAISVSNVSKNSIRRLVNQKNMIFPVFQDQSRKFSANYGTGYIPLLILVNSEGKYIRYTKNGEPMLKALDADIKELYGM